MSLVETESVVEAAPRDGGTVLAEERTDLAVQRTIFAMERTLMAWIRTALSMIGLAFSIYKFFQYLPEEVAAAGTSGVRGRRATWGGA